MSPSYCFKSVLVIIALFGLAQCRWIARERVNQLADRNWAETELDQPDYKSEIRQNQKSESSESREIPQNPYFVNQKSESSESREEVSEYKELVPVKVETSDENVENNEVPDDIPAPQGLVILARNLLVDDDEQQLNDQPSLWSENERIAPFPGRVIINDKTDSDESVEVVPMPAEIIEPPTETEQDSEKVVVPMPAKIIDTRLQVDENSDENNDEEQYEKINKILDFLSTNDIPETQQNADRHMNEDPQDRDGDSNDDGDDGNNDEMRQASNDDDDN